MIPLLMGALLAAAATLHTLPPAQVDAWLARQAAAGLPFDARLQQAVDATLGTPYHDGPLGEGPSGKYDKDPLVDLTRVDCVTFIEQAVALAVSPDVATATDKLQRIRYKNGQIDFATRNHFFEADWLRNNPWCREVTAQLGVPTETVTRTIDRAAFFRKVSAPDVGQDLAPEQVMLTYIPTGNAAAAESKIPTGSIVAFVGKVDWLFSLHTGLFMNGKLCHASSQAGKAVAVDFSDYVASQEKRYIGFIVYRVGEPQL